MKKILLAAFMGVVLVGCSTNQTDQPKEKKHDVKQEVVKKDNKAAETKTESKYPFPESAQTVGDANIITRTPSGTSENGKVPVFFVKPDDVLVQVGLDLENFQGDKETFIYVNKIFIETEQVGELTQTSLDLDGDLLKPGIYIVTAIQFENNDPNGKVVNFVEAKYEVKAGS